MIVVMQLLGTHKKKIQTIEVWIFCIL